MRGRKPIYSPETLKLGEKMPLSRAKRKYGHQYAHNFNRRMKRDNKGNRFRFVNDGNESYIERVI